MLLVCLVAIITQTFVEMFCRRNFKGKYIINHCGCIHGQCGFIVLYLKSWEWCWHDFSWKNWLLVRHWNWICKATIFTTSVIWSFVVMKQLTTKQQWLPSSSKYAYVWIMITMNMIFWAILIKMYLIIILNEDMKKTRGLQFVRLSESFSWLQHLIF